MYESGAWQRDGRDMGRGQSHTMCDWGEGDETRGMRPEGVDGRSILEWVWNGGVASLMRSQIPWRGVVGVFVPIYIGGSDEDQSPAHNN